MKEDKGCFHYIKLLILLAVLAIAGPLARPVWAATAPDSFREKVVDVTTHCYPVFDRLSQTYWPGRDAGEVAELKQDAVAKRDYSLDMLRRYSAIYSNFDINEQIAKGEADLSLGGMSQDELLDIAVFCEKKLFEVIDEEEANGYTP